MTSGSPYTVEAWIEEWLCGTTIALRVDPGTSPDVWEREVCQRDVRPTRPAGLVAVERTQRSVRPGALRSVSGRIRVLHTFCHHEVQAAELFGWAILRFADAEPEFREGLLKQLHDELRHARMYIAELERHGASYGDLPVRDWFWERVPQCQSPQAFVAFLGLGLEGGNLEHARRYAAGFRAVGDESGALVQEQIAREEEGHVRFAAHWFKRWTNGLDFEEWRALLPEPLSPTLLKGAPLDRAARMRAGFDTDFLDLLEAWPCRTSGS